VARRALDRLSELKARRGREVEVEDAASLPDAVVAASAAAPGELPAASRGRRLERLVMMLPAMQRMAVTLYYYEDRSVEQAAAILEMPENTVKTHLARARAARWLTWIEPEVLPWWVRAAAEPATALSLALAALVSWQYPVLARFAAAAIQALASPAVATFMHRWSAPRIPLDLSAFSDPFVFTGLVLAGLPFAWWAGLAVYHWSGDPQTLRTARR
jgi:hypothetical protein